MVEELFHYYENYSKLHPGQIRGRKERSAIQIVASLIHMIQEKWQEI